MRSMRQLALPLGLAPPCLRPQDYLECRSNEGARRWAERPQAWPDGRLVVWGGEGCGKSHLLQVWAAREHAARLEGPFLSRLPSIEAPAITLDDADMAPDPEVMLHLLNVAAERRLSVLLAGRLPASRWDVQLPDLSSRLRATISVEIGQPDDEMLRALLVRQLAERQLAVSQTVQEWLLCRLPRTGAAIREAVARLDYAALAAGGHVDRSVAAAIIAELSKVGESSAALSTSDSPRRQSLL